MRKLASDSSGGIVTGTMSILIMISLALFGVWAYASYLDQKNNTDEKIAEAVTAAEAALTQELEADFTNREKQPYVTYTSPSATGSVKISYPRTWSAYVDERETGSTPVDAIFHPKFVPARDVNYGLRVTIENRDYDSELASYESRISSGKLSSRPVKKSGQTGIFLRGELDGSTNGAAILFPIRDKTLTIWTESTDFINDLETITLERLSFEP